MRETRSSCMDDHGGESAVSVAAARRRLALMSQERIWQSGDGTGRRRRWPAIPKRRRCSVLVDPNGRRKGTSFTTVRGDRRRSEVALPPIYAVNRRRPATLPIPKPPRASDSDSSPSASTTVSFQFLFGIQLISFSRGIPRRRRQRGVVTAVWTFGIYCNNAKGISTVWVA